LEIEWEPKLNLFRAMRRLPQPLKSLLALFLAAFVLVFLGSILAVAIRTEAWVRIMVISYSVLGVIGFVLGAALLADFRGSAQAYSGMMKNYKPLGVDYSKSFITNPRFIRLFGAGYMLIGIWFVVLTILMLQGPIAV
jgi:hypothetical protein